MIATELKFRCNQRELSRLSPVTFEHERSTEIPMTNQNQNPGQQNQNPGQNPTRKPGQQGGGQKPGQQQQDPNRQGQKPNPRQQSGH